MPTSPRVERRTLELPPRKPMARARRVALFEREIRIRLSPAAIEVLFEIAAVLSEGGPDGDRYFGSTMITIDLGRAGGAVAEECDVAAARRVAELIVADDRVRDRARRLAATQAERLAGQRLVGPQIDLRVRRTGRNLHLDLDVEAPLQPTRSAKPTQPAKPAARARRKS